MQEGSPLAAAVSLVITSFSDFDNILILPIDLLTWNRGSDDLWDKWASITDDPGWSWANVQQFYFKVNPLFSRNTKQGLMAFRLPESFLLRIITTQRAKSYHLHMEMALSKRACQAFQVNLIIA